ncbi:transposase family protein, partial [Streptomyces sp. NPDC052101]|uniref:transposase family protein n=1 Tax=Streptomyces sp. NPDC052101 TaxID=3155763 RepID=UPI00342D5C0E
MFSGLSALVVEDVTDGGDAVVVTARTRKDAVPCPVCGTPTAKVHGYHGRTLTDVPVDGRQVVVRLRVRRLAGRARGHPGAGSVLVWRGGGEEFVLHVLVVGQGLRVVVVIVDPESGALPAGV